MGAPFKPPTEKLTRIYVSLTLDQLDKIGLEKVRELCRQIINKEYRKIK